MSSYRRNRFNKSSKPVSAPIPVPPPASVSTPDSVSTNLFIDGIIWGFGTSIGKHLFELFKSNNKVSEKTEKPKDTEEFSNK